MSRKTVTLLLFSVIIEIMLEKYAKTQKLKTYMTFIREQFIEYRTLTTDCITLLKNNSELRNKAILKIELMVSKFDEIELSLCDNLEN